MGAGTLKGRNTVVGVLAIAALLGFLAYHVLFDVHMSHILSRVGT